MSKRNLKDKISDVIFWTVVFIIIYFLVAYLLESNWLEETLKLKEVYSLLKDTLGLTAAFLAPVAALLIFNDWRDEHVILNNKDLSIKIKESINDSFWQIKLYLISPSLPNTITTLDNLHKNLSQLEKSLMLIEDENQGLDEYIESCKVAKHLIHETSSILLLIKYNDEINSIDFSPFDSKFATELQKIKVFCDGLKKNQNDIKVLKIK